MATREEKLIEANKRGLLTGERKEKFDEAVRRGIIVPPPLSASEMRARATMAQDRPSPLGPIEQEPGRMPISVIAEGTARRAVDNLGNIGPGTGRLIADAAAVAKTGVESFGDNEQDFGTRLDQNRAAERERFPASFLQKLPSVTSNDIVAGIQTALEVAGTGLQHGAASVDPFADQPPDRPPIGDIFDQKSEADIERLVQTRETNPKSAFAGDLFGDALTLMTGRVPLTRARRRRLIEEEPVFTPGANNIYGSMKDTAQSKFAQSLGSGIKKAGETTFEGAMLAALNDNDPLKTAAMSAGAQAVGSMTTAAAAVALAHPEKSLLAGLVAIQMFKTVTPGGRDRILESSESTFDKYVAMMALGTVAALGGFGSQTPKQLKQWGAYGDSFATLRRGSVLSLLSDISNDAESGGNTTESVLQQLATEPEYFGKTATRRLIRAYKNGTFGDEIDKLASADRNFLRQLNELEPVEVSNE